MGQRVLQEGPRPAAQTPRGGTLAVFPTEVGWFGLLGQEGTVARLVIGHTGPEEVRRALVAADSNGDLAAGESADASRIVEDDWQPDLRRDLQRYAGGVPADFGEWTIRLPRRTPFQRRVLEVVRAIPYAETATYGEVARQAGRPGAARAVGNVMAGNPLPILIPCHRVVAAGGRFGGYSAPQGVDLKRRLLAMEAGGRTHRD